MNIISRVHYYTITILVLLSSIAFSAGISVDAGLTPAEDRWIFRSQVRYMQRDSNGSGMAGKMENTMVMTVRAVMMVMTATAAVMTATTVMVTIPEMMPAMTAAMTVAAATAVTARDLPGIRAAAALMPTVQMTV